MNSFLIAALTMQHHKMGWTLNFYGRIAAQNAHTLAYQTITKHENECLTYMFSDSWWFRCFMGRRNEMNELWRNLTSFTNKNVSASHQLNKITHLRLALLRKLEFWKKMLCWLIFCDENFKFWSFFCEKLLSSNYNFDNKWIF